MVCYLNQWRVVISEEHIIKEFDPSIWNYPSQYAFSYSSFDSLKSLVNALTNNIDVLVKSKENKKHMSEIQQILRSNNYDTYIKKLLNNG